MAVSEPCTSSGQLAVGTSTVYAHPALLYQVTLNPAAAVCSVTVYDNASAGSGTVLAVLNSPASGASVTFYTSAPVMCKNGITVVVAGTGATANVYWTPSS